MASEDLLKLLEAHGQQFLQSFDSPVVIGKRKDTSRLGSDRKQKKSKKAKVVEESEEEAEEEEWTGFGNDSSSGEEESEDPSSGESDGESDEEDAEGSGPEDGMCTRPGTPLPAPHLSTDDDGFRYDNQTQSSRRLPDVVVFSEAGGSALIPKKSKSGFMVGEHQNH